MLGGQCSRQTSRIYIKHVFSLSSVLTKIVGSWQLNVSNGNNHGFYHFVIHRLSLFILIILNIHKIQ